MVTRCEILPVDPVSPDEDTILRAAARIRTGGLVVFPTSSFYGLGTSALDTAAVDRVFRVKNRDPRKPLLILIGSLVELSPLVQSVPESGVRLIETFWPGTLTLVFQASDVLPSNLTGHTGKIGIRLANHAVAASLVRAVGGPITGTSANLSGHGGCNLVSLLDSHIRNQVDLVLDAGELKGQKVSTVVDVTVDPPRVLREGVIDAAQVMQALHG
jgi:L-threonylcarbamoyladenylate synthase